MTVERPSPKERRGGSTTTGPTTSRGQKTSKSNTFPGLVPKGKPFKLTAPEPSENELHAACARLLDLVLMPPAMWCCYPAGHIQLLPHQAARLARMGLKRGIPDIMIFWGGVLGIELKRGGERLSKTKTVRTRRGSLRELLGQEDVFPRLMATGAWKDIRVARSTQEMIQHLVDWRVPLRYGGKNAGTR